MRSSWNTPTKALAFLMRYRDVIRSGAHTLTIAVAGVAVWIPLLFRSRRVSATF